MQQGRFGGSMRAYQSIGEWGLKAVFALTSLLVAMTLSWVILAQSNFLYTVWHDHAGIGEGVTKFGPKNRYKPGFGETTAAQRAALFSEINIAVHAGGDGLAQIEYQTPSSKGVQKMLRKPEIDHLVDVANLISLLKWVAIVNALIWALLLFFALRTKKVLFGWLSQLGGIGGVLVLAATIILLIGPVKVFNQLHIWIFPKENQWFFYYQDSLMSTLMMAPNLFGWIAVALVALAVLIFICLLHGCIYLERRIKDKS